MSRIINENYTIKLNSTLEGFDFSDNLKSLIDFLHEQVKNDQSRKNRLFSVKDFNLLQQIKESKETKRILSYLNRLIKSFQGNYLQIHLNIDLDEIVLNQLIFLLTKVSEQIIVSFGKDI